MNLIRMLCVCGSLILLAGCTEGQKSEQVKEIYLTGVNRQRAIEISEEVLRDFNFSISKEDANTGYIITRPLAGGQFFEFWRKDNVGAFNIAESSIQNIRRIAQLKISEVGQTLCINCNVKVQRLHLSELSEERAGFKYDRITGQQIRTTGPSLDIMPEQMTWIELGSDEKLAAAILRKVEGAVLKR